MKYTNTIWFLAAGLLQMLFVNNVSAQFVVHNNGADVTVSAGCVVSIVTGDLNNDAGAIDNAGRITVDGTLTNGDILTGAGSSTGIFNVAGDWINNASFSADQSVVNLNGGNQLIGGSVISSFYNLNLLGSGIKSLDIDAHIEGLLQLNNLELATGVHTLRVLNPSSLAITENGGFVSSVGLGRLSRAMNSTDTYVFPLGSSIGTPRIRPVAITPASTSANTFGARLANVDATTEGYDVSLLASDLCHVNNQFYHLIDHLSGSDAADVTQYYEPTNDGDWSVGAHWQGTPRWEDMTNEVLGTSGGYSTITTPGWTDFTLPAFALANEIPDVSIASVAPLCEHGTAVSLSATPSGGTFSGPGVSGNTFDPTTVGGGTHTVTYIYQNLLGCENTATMQIEVADAPSVTITSSANGALELCDGETMDLAATPGYVSYEWNTSQTDQSITIDESGAYSVMVTDADGCTGTSAVAYVTVQPTPAPVATASGPLAFCEGESVTLSTAPNQGAYLWSGTGSTTPTTVVQESGTYFVTVTNQYGCEGSSNAIEVDVTPMDDAVILVNGDDLTVNPPGTNYQWFLNGDPIPGATSIDYTAIQSGNYHVEYIGPNGCPTATNLLEFTLQVGVDEYAIFDILDVYPNPGKGVLMIRGGLPIPEDVTIELTNMLGQALQPAVEIAKTNSFNQPMDISRFANGMYFIRITAAERTFTVRYIKN